MSILTETEQQTLGRSLKKPSARQPEELPDEGEADGYQ
jgi:hypothetical protein